LRIADLFSIGDFGLLDLFWIESGMAFRYPTSIATSAIIQHRSQSPAIIQHQSAIVLQSVNQQ